MGKDFYMNEFIYNENEGLYLWKNYTDIGYKDGSEEYLLSIFERIEASAYPVELQFYIKDWASRYHLSYIRTNLLESIRELFNKEWKVLEIGAGMGALTVWMSENFSLVDAVEGSFIRGKVLRERVKNKTNVRVFIGDAVKIPFPQKDYNLVTLVGVLEYIPLYSKSRTPEDACIDFLTKVKESMNEDGIVLIAIENKLGVKYFSGCTEDHTGRLFDGLMGYPMGDSPVTFSRYEIEYILRNAGFENIQFYHLFPDYKLPTLFIRETDEIEKLNPHYWIRGLFEDYSNNRKYLIPDPLLLETVVKANLLKHFSNSFLILASPSKNSSLSTKWLIKKIWNPHRYKSEFHHEIALYPSENGLIVKRTPLRFGGKEIVYSDKIIFQLQNGEYIQGKLLIYEAYKALLKDDDYVALTELIKKVFTNLLKEFGVGTDENGYHLVDGNAIDYTFWNLLITSDNEIIFIDKKWRYRDILPADFILFRNLCYLFDSIHPFIKEKNKSEFVINIVKRIYQQYNYIRLSQNENLEREFQTQICITPQEDKLKTTQGVPVYDNYRGKAYPKVSIIIPVFNKVELTRKCVEEIQKNTPEELYELIIVDNGSTDGTKEFLKWLETNFKNVKIIINEKNLGFAKACNQGANVASTDYLLFLNNDTEPLKGWLEPLLYVMEHDNLVGAVGSKLLFPDGTIQHAGVIIVKDQKLGDPLGGRHIYYGKPSDLPEANQMRTYQALTGACLLIRKSAFNEVGGFDEEYWNGYEDVDLCFKLQEMGWKLVYQPKSVVIHYESQSGPERFSKWPQNVQRLHKKWIGKVKPDIVITKNGSVIVAKDNKIKPYRLPGLSSAETIKDLTSIIILTFNQLEYTKKCVESIKRCTPEQHEIIFVDNGSKDGTVQWLRKLVSENNNYRLIENKENLGFAKGCNQGIKAARGEYIVLLNNDVIVTKGWLSGLIDCLKKAPNAGIIGPMTNNISGIQKIPVDYKDESSIENFAKRFRETWRGRRIPSRRVVGFCMLFRKELVDKIGLFDESFGTGNFEDDDFCLRAELAGYQNYIAGDVFIHHYGSRSFIGNKIDYSALISGNRKKFDEKWNAFALDLESEVGKSFLCLNMLESAEELYQKGEFTPAIKELITGLKIQPENKRLLYSLAEKLIELKQYELCMNILKKSTFAMDDLRLYLLTGYCEEGLGNIDSADKIASEVLSLDNNNPLALNLKGIVHYKRGEKEKAVQYFKQAIEADPGYGEPYTNLGFIAYEDMKTDEGIEYLERGFKLSPTVFDISSLYYSAISNESLYERAEKFFEEAVRLYPLHKQNILFYIDILIRTGKLKKAMDFIEKSIVRLGVEDDKFINVALSVREMIGYRKIVETSKKPTLSLAMIVKNEENYLAHCLESVKNLVDEIVIVDTGSQDKTKEIAKVFGAKVYDFPWNGDFSEARNFSLSKAEGDWILVLDADEIIAEREHRVIRELIKKGRKKAYAMTIRNYTNKKLDNTILTNWKDNTGEYIEERGLGWFPSVKVRLFPNDKRLRFENPVNEVIDNSIKREGYEIVTCPVTVHHYGRLNEKRIEERFQLYFELKNKLDWFDNKQNGFNELAVMAFLIGKLDEIPQLMEMKT